MATIVIKNISTQPKYIRDLQDTLEPGEEVTFSRSLGELTGMNGLNAAIDAGEISILSSTFGVAESAWTERGVPTLRSVNLGTPQPPNSTSNGDIAPWQDGFARQVSGTSGDPLARVVLRAHVSGPAANGVAWEFSPDGGAGVSMESSFNGGFIAHYQPGVSTGNDVIAAINGFSNAITAIESPSIPDVLTDDFGGFGGTLQGGCVPGDVNNVLDLSNPDVPRIVSIAFGGHWNGGDILLTGTNKFGATVSERVVGSPGSTVSSANVYSTITKASKTATRAPQPGFGDDDAAFLSGGDYLGLPIKPTEDSATVFVGSASSSGAVNKTNASVQVSGADGTSTVIVQVTGTSV